MRLIDANALNYKNLAEVNGRLTYVLTAEEIDNAPTVEPCYQTTACLDCDNYDKENHNCPRYCEVIKEAINSRPQGEWIDHSEDYGYVECPICEHLTNCEGDVDELHYCWNCGAKLGKAVNEDDKI